MLCRRDNDDSLFRILLPFSKGIQIPLEQQREPVVEATRYVLVALIPIVVWFTWWATMGQLDGFTHPRDIDPEIST